MGVSEQHVHHQRMTGMPMHLRHYRLQFQAGRSLSRADLSAFLHLPASGRYTLHREIK